MKNELVRDEDGKIRNCPTNRVKLGYWKSFNEFHNYKDITNIISLSEVVEALVMLFNVVLLIIFIPVLPFIRCYFANKQAKRDVAAQMEIDKLHK